MAILPQKDTQISRFKETHLLLIIVFPLFELVLPFWHPSSVKVMRGQLVAEIGLPLPVLPPEAVFNKGKPSVIHS